MEPQSDPSTHELTLIRKSQSGDQDAFRRLMEKYQDYIFDLCFRVLANAQDAEDAAQETFLQFYRNLSRYKTEFKLSNWLYTIALNLCRKKLRRKKIVRFFSLDHSRPGWDEDTPQDFPDPGPSVEEQVDRKRSVALAQQLVGFLPDSLKYPFILRHFKGLAYDEIAQILGISLAKVKVRIYRAKIRLWDKYKSSLNTRP